MRWNTCVHRLDLGLYSHPKEFWGNGVRTHANSKGKIPSTGKKILPAERSNPGRCIKQDSGLNTLPVSYSGPLSGFYLAYMDGRAGFDPRNVLLVSWLGWW